MLSGKQLKIRRIELDIKAKEIADVLHIHSSYVSKLENEVQAIPEYLLEKWVNFLGMRKGRLNE